MTPRETYRCRMCVVLTLLFIFILLIGLSFSKVQYYQYAFSKNSLSGKLDRSRVYESGLYMVGPSVSFVTYESTIQRVDLEDLAVWSKSDGDDAGTPLEMDIDLQYTLDPAQLDALYSKVGLEHEPFVRNVAINVLKNNATLFSADEYLQSRRTIEVQFKNALVAECREAAHVIVTNVQLSHVQFPESFYSRKLAASVQEQRNLIEDFKQEATLVRGNTTIDAQDIQNDAREISQVSTAEANLKVQQAENEAIKIRGQAEREGLLTLAERLNITDQKQLLSLNYLVTLSTKGAGGKKFVNFGLAPDAKSLIN